jgi:hypothetical protein
MIYNLMQKIKKFLKADSDCCENLEIVPTHIRYYCKARGTAYCELERDDKFFCERKRCQCYK